MSPSDAECVRCQAYETEVILLRQEVAGLRNSVLNLSRPAPVGPSSLEITDRNEPGRLVLSGPVVSGTDLFYRVTLTFRDQLSTQCQVPIDDPQDFLRFFDELAQHKHGWEGEKRISSHEGQLAITCRFEGKMFRPEISIDVFCALDSPSFDPFWSARLHLDVDPESLDVIAAQARALFSTRLR